MCGQDTESVSEADLIKDPKTYSRLPETLIAGREKRAIKKSIKLETAEYYEWADYDHQGVYSGKRGRGRPRKRPPFSGPSVSCSVPGCEMTSAVAASFDDEKSGKQRAAVFPFPEGDDNLVLGKRWIDFCTAGDKQIPDNLDGICSMHFLRSSMTNLYDKLVLLENSVPTIRGPPGSDCSEAERDVLERAEEKMTKQEAWKGSMSAVPKTAADYVREAAQKTKRMKRSFDDILAYVDSSGAPLGIETEGAFIKEQELDFDEAVFMMKKLAKRPWASHEDAERVYIYRMSVPKDDVPPVCTDMLLIDKAARTMSMENCGESVPLDVFAPDDFDAATGFLLMRPTHVSSFMARMTAKKTAAYTIDERTALRIATRLLRSVLEDEGCNTPKKSLRFLSEQLSYLDGSVASQMTFSPALIRLCSTLRGLGPDCYDVLVDERVLNLPPRRFFLMHGAPTNWEIKRQIKEKAEEVRQKKIDGLRMRAERVRQEKRVAESATLTPSGKKRRLKKVMTSAGTGDLSGAASVQQQIIMQDGSFLAVDGHEQSETYTIQVHEAVDDSSAVVADHVTVQGGIVVGEHGQQIRYEQVVEGGPAVQGEEDEDGSNPQTVEIVVHPPEEQQVLVQEVSTAAVPSAAAGPAEMLVEQQIPETDSENVRREPLMQQQPANPKPRTPKIVPKKPLKKQATISVKDEETAAIKAGMDLALGIAGKEYKKYVRPDKVFADGTVADPAAHKANPDLYSDCVRIPLVGSNRDGEGVGADVGGSNPSSKEKLSSTVHSKFAAPAQVPYARKRKVIKQPKTRSLVPVSFEEMQRIMKGKSLKLVPNQKSMESKD